MGPGGGGIDRPQSCLDSFAATNFGAGAFTVVQ